MLACVDRAEMGLSTTWLAQQREPFTQLEWKRERDTGSIHLHQAVGRCQGPSQTIKKISQHSGAFLCSKQNNPQTP